MSDFRPRTDLHPQSPARGLRTTAQPTCLTIIVLALTLLPRAALAAWPHFPNTNLPISTAVNEQSTIAMISDGAGGAILAWQDFRGGSFYDIYAQHVLASGKADPAWPVNGLAVCAATNNQQTPAITSDGIGGAIIAWIDLRGGVTFDIYVQHVLSTGSVDGAWPSDGRALCTATGNQLFPAMVSDNGGGAIVTWQDNRSGTTHIYAHHVNAMGFPDPAWPLDGRALCLAVNGQQLPAITTDGAGGAIVTWYDLRGGTNDIYAQHVSSGGVVDPSWPVDGRAVSTAGGNQTSPVIDVDGAGGAYIAWIDNRVGAGDIYAQHVLATGAVDPSWTLNGNPVSTAANSQINPAIVSDGRGGALLAWQDNRTGNYDIYAHHLVPSGVDLGWTPDGRSLCTAGGDQQFPQIVTDGSGGAVVAWQDSRVGNTLPGTYAQHVTATGAVDTSWPTDGRAASTATSSEVAPRLVADGAGGAVIAWSDSRAGNSDVYAQRVARFGYLGTPEAVISSVTDVPNDQGGRAKVSWDPSWLDTESDPNLSLYEVWRSVPGSVAEAAIRAGVPRLSGFAERPAGRAIVSSAQAYWEYLGSQSAVHYIPGYAYLAATTGDSTGAFNPKTAFMVVARNAAGTMYWLSAPVSGYSVDNLGPAAPAPFTGQYSGGASHLHWDPNTEPDLAGYRLYRGTSAGFVPSPGTQVAALTDTGYVDAAGSPYYYKLSAIDIHGNESGYSLLLPSGTLGVDGAPARLWLARPSPNPAMGTTTLRWSLPRAGDVSLAVFDASGRRLRVLAQGACAAGEHTLAWDLRDDHGAALPSGLCFVRLAADGQTLVQRLATLR